MPLGRNEVIAASGLDSWQVPPRRPWEGAHGGAFREGAALAAMGAAMREQRTEAEALQRAVLRGRRVQESSHLWWLEASIFSADRSGDVEAAEARTRRGERAAVRVPLVAEADSYDPKKYLCKVSPNVEIVTKSAVLACSSLGVLDAAAALLAACEAGDERVLERLMRRHDSGSLLRYEQVGSKKSALHLAAQRGHVVICARLLEHAADVLAPDRHGRSPLVLACMHARPLIVKQLLNAKSQPAMWDSMERNALHLACCSSDPGTVALLLGHSPSLINQPDGRGRTGLWYSLCSVHRTSREHLMKLLLRQRADVNLADAYGRSPLWYASKKGITSLVYLLLNHNADPNISDLEGLSPLDVARGFTTGACFDIDSDNGWDDEYMARPPAEILSVSMPRDSPSSPEASPPAIDVTGVWSCNEGMSLIMLRQDATTGAVAGEIASVNPGRPDLAFCGRVIEDELIYTTGPSQERTTFRLRFAEGCQALRGTWQDFRGGSGNFEMQACQSASPGSPAAAEEKSEGFAVGFPNVV